MSVGDSIYLKRFFSLYAQEEKDKVRGHAFYPTDYMSVLPNDVLRALVVRSPYPGADLGNIDIKAAEKVPGVVRVITAKDVPHNLPFGSRKSGGQLILAESKVRYTGEPVAIIVSKTVEAGRAALDALTIDWVPQRGSKPEVAEEFNWEHGKPAAGRWEEHKSPFWFPTLQARYLEAECGWVSFANNQLTFHIGSLLSEAQRTWLSDVLGISKDQILADESPLGGQFGGRQQRELMVFLALSAWLTKHSVALQFSTHEQDVGSYGYSGEMSIFVDPKSKRVKELRGIVQIDAGSYEGNAKHILEKTLEHIGSIYNFDYIALTGKVLITNTHPRRALRGEGLTAVTWVTEQLMERVAKTLETPPLEFRQAHLRENVEGVSRVVSEVEKLEKPFRLVPIDRTRPVWGEKEILGRGYGFQVFQPTVTKEFDYSEIAIELQPQGSFLIRTSNITLDLHVKNALAEVAAPVLRTHPKAFTVVGKMRKEFQKPARRETYPEFYHLAQATWHAAAALKAKLEKAGRTHFGSDVVLKDGAIEVAGTNRKIGYREFAFSEVGKDLSASYVVKDIDRPHGCSAGAVARVTFHPLTGEMRVDSVKVVVDAGPVFYRPGLEMTVDSAVSWAMATLFSSEVVESQPIPTPLDGPEEVTLIPIEYPVHDFSDAPPDSFGARGIDDVLMSVVLASLVNAIYDAKGVPLEEIPMSLEFMYPKKRSASVHMIPFKRQP